MQPGEQLNTLAMTGIVVDGGGDQRARVTNDHGSAAETVGQQLVHPRRRVRPAGGERTEPRWRPRRHRASFGQPPHLGQRRRHLLLR